MPLNVIQCHSLSSLTVTILSCPLHLPRLDVSLSLSLSLPLPLDERVLIDAKEDGEAKRNKRAWNYRIQTQCTNTYSYNKFAVQAGTGDIPPETPCLVTIVLGFALSHYGPLILFVTSHKK